MTCYKITVIFQMDDSWQPDEFLSEFDKESFDVEDHATEIFKKGNVNEEVSTSSVSSSVLLHAITFYFRFRN